eukprot:335941-Alexandrium_andersonii.AAC.1
MSPNSNEMLHDWLAQQRLTDRTKATYGTKRDLLATDRWVIGAEGALTAEHEDEPTALACRRGTLHPLNWAHRPARTRRAPSIAWVRRLSLEPLDPPAFRNT